jgi:hypothetical protein
MMIEDLSKTKAVIDVVMMVASTVTATSPAMMAH